MSTSSIGQYIEETRCLKLDRPAGKYLTDLYAAEQVVKEFGLLQRHCQAIGDLIWDKYRWRRDDTAEVMKLVKRTVRGLYARAEKIDEDDKRKAFIEWAKSCESNAKLKAIAALVSTEPGIQLRVDELDADPYLLNTMSGTVDLRTGELHPHNRTDYLTKVAPVLYDPTADCGRWNQFLNRIFAGDAEMIRFVQRAVGCALIGSVHEHVLHILYGTGQNGKSVFIETLHGLLGDYASIAAPKLLLARKYDEHPTEIADLRGRRFVATVESGEGNRLDEPKVKQLTGGDTLKGRYMRRDFFDFEPSHTVFMATNHKPEVKGSDFGIWRRIRLWPFTVTILESERDPRLKEKLEAEYPGILAWAVRGCLEWQQHGFGEPRAVTDATNEYRSESDRIEAFLSERCTTGQSTTGLAPRVGASELYAAYKSWAESGNEDVMNQTRFGKAMSEKGFRKDSSVGTRRTVYVGVGLADCSADGDSQSDPAMNEGRVPF